MWTAGTRCFLNTSRITLEMFTFTYTFISNVFCIQINYFIKISPQALVLRMSRRNVISFQDTGIISDFPSASRLPLPVNWSQHLLWSGVTGIFLYQEPCKKYLLSRDSSVGLFLDQIPTNKLHPPTLVPLSVTCSIEALFGFTHIVAFLPFLDMSSQFQNLFYTM